MEWEKIINLENDNTFLTKIKNLGHSPESYILSVSGEKCVQSSSLGYAAQDVHQLIIGKIPGIFCDEGIPVIHTQDEKTETGDHQFKYRPLDAPFDYPYITIKSEHKVANLIYRKTKGDGIGVDISHRDSRMINFPSGPVRDKYVLIDEYDILSIVYFNNDLMPIYFYSLLKNIPMYKPKSKRGKQKIMAMSIEDQEFIENNCFAKHLTIDLPIVFPWTNNLEDLLKCLYQIKFIY